MVKHSKRHSQSAQPVPRGFMEPTAEITHHEDIYGVSQFEEDRVESYAFDFCDDDKDDDDDDDEDEGGGDIDETPSKRRVIGGPSSGSRGVIKKPKCKVSWSSGISFIITEKIHADKPRSEVSAGNNLDSPRDPTAEVEDDSEENTDAHTWFKISPRQNPRHSISVTPAVSERQNSIERAVNKSSPSASPSDLKNKRSAEAYSAEKTRQHQLTPSVRFQLIRKQRRQDRGKIHTACAKARKVKEGARKNAAASQACLVDDVAALPGSREPYVLVDRSEAPSEFVDFPTPLQAGNPRSEIAKAARLCKKVLSPMKNWKGEETELKKGEAYVFVVVGE